MSYLSLKSSTRSHPWLQSLFIVKIVVFGTMAAQVSTKILQHTIWPETWIWPFIEVTFGSNNDIYTVISLWRGFIIGGMWSIWVFISCFIVYRSWKLVRKAPFSIIVILALTIFSIIGTLIPQFLTYEQFLKFYPASWYTSFQYIGLLDFYHNYWFGSLLFLMGASLLSLTLQKPKTLPYLGFHMSHVGLIIILIGGMLSFFLTKKGRIDLYVDSPSSRNAIALDAGGQPILQKIDTFNPTTKSYERVTRPVVFSLGFEVKLDRFEASRYSPEHKVYTYQRRPHPKIPDQDEYILRRAQTIINQDGSLSKERIDSVHNVFGTQFYYRINQFYGNLVFAGVEEADDSPAQPILAFKRHRLDSDHKTTAPWRFLQLDRISNNYISPERGQSDVFFLWDWPSGLAGALHEGMEIEGRNEKDLLLGKTFPSLPSPHYLMIEGAEGPLPPVTLKEGEVFNLDPRVGIYCERLIPNYRSLGTSSSQETWSNPVAEVSFRLHLEGEADGGSPRTGKGEKPSVHLFLGSYGTLPYVPPSVNDGLRYEELTGVKLRYEYRRLRYVIIGKHGLVLILDGDRVKEIHSLEDQKTFPVSPIPDGEFYSFQSVTEKPTPAYRELDGTLSSPALSVSVWHNDEPDLAYNFVLMEKSGDGLFFPLHRDKDKTWQETMDRIILSGMRGQSQEEGSFILLASREEAYEMFESTLIFSEKAPGKPASASKETKALMRVNYPYHFGGWDFFQVDFNPQRPGYSGVFVVSDPGEFIVYAGLLISIIGIILLFFFDSFSLSPSRN